MITYTKLHSIILKVVPCRMHLKLHWAARPRTRLIGCIGFMLFICCIGCVNLLRSHPINIQCLDCHPTCVQKSHMSTDSQIQTINMVIWDINKQFRYINWNSRCIHSYIQPILVCLWFVNPYIRCINLSIHVSAWVI